MNWKSIKKPLSYDEIKEIEKSLNIILPEDYCRIIGEINGGALASASCEVPNLGNVPYSRNVSLSKKAKVNAMLLYEQLKDLHLFPFGSVGNGDYFCFDLAKEQIVLYQHETGAIWPVCKTFEEFLSRIVEQ